MPSVFKLYRRFRLHNSKGWSLWPTVAIAVTAGVIGWWTFQYYERRKRVENLTNSVDIEFLNLETGRELFQSPVCDFARTLRHRESLARTGQPPKEALNRYLKGILEFSDLEQNTIRNFIGAVRVLSDIKWKFLKMQSDLDWGFPYTVGDVVILPQRVVADLVTPGIAAQKRGISETLLHEHLHIRQRQEPNKFKAFYERYYHMKHFPDLIIPTAVEETLVTNPDGLDVCWVFQCPQNDPELCGDWFFCMQLDQDLQIVKSAYPVVAGEVLPTGEIPLKSFARYFEGLENCYHPNEIFSYLHSKQILYNSTLEA